MEKRNNQLEHGQPMEQTRPLFCTRDSGVAHCQSQHQFYQITFDLNRSNGVSFFFVCGNLFLFLRKHCSHLCLEQLSL